ncbi:EAL domain-containing protein [Rhodopirellula sp. SWK7]|uniref:sensor domain-containing protein n=1 Tax=Rhodopirellula sp. SWK7 TaxID=595460 RepID=UPI0002BEA769|nr:EAL domain-containing protein [Rhodopirellula sp. SWK7]EMI47276.1 sensory box/GGDEF domain/EAL domain protein [Rhodopirellula sp. SWK7]
MLDNNSTAIDFSSTNTPKSPVGTPPCEPSLQVSVCEDMVDASILSIDHLLSLAKADDLASRPSACIKLVESMASSMALLKAEVQLRDEQLEKLTQKSERMARAQADAIVHSVEIIDELEITKRSLDIARTAAENAAQDTKRLADTIFERTNDAVMVFENETCVDCNDNTVQLFACVRDEIVGGWPDAFRHAKLEDGNSADSHLRYLYQSVDDRNSKHAEVRMCDDTGNQFWSEIRFSSFSMRGGGHVLVVVRDITARKQFETELCRHRDFLNNVISAVPDQLSVRSSDQRLVLANDAFCEAHSLTRSDAVGRKMHDLGLESYAFPSENAGHPMAPAHSNDAIEESFVAADGSSRIASIKHSTFSDATSGESYLIATSRDITEDRRREDRLRVLASVFNSASEGVAILSSDGLIREANPAFVSMASNALGVPSLEATGLLDVRFCDAMQIDAGLFESTLSDLNSGTPWSGKATVKSDANRGHAVWISLSPSHFRDTSSDEIIALVSDITELENSQIELHRRAMHDSLTTLPNRVYFREELSRLVRLDQSPHDGLSVCFLDLDDFKLANDSLGHASGDQLLCLVGERIQKNMGDKTFVARFGGDEFALIMQDKHLAREQQYRLLDQLIRSFREPFRLDGDEARIGLSIGVARCPEDSSDADVLMRNADIAMYAAKNAGKNLVLEFTHEMQDGVDLRHQVQSKLRRALSNGEIDVHFQPKINATTHELVGCEALARWKTSDGNYISPAEFVPIAEQTGLVTGLGDLVFELAAERAFRWHESGLIPKIAVNVSPHHLRHPRFLMTLESTLRKSGAKAEWFELEITENAMMENVDHAIDMIRHLGEMGFTVAIDDFGTGYSSLSYLKSFPIDTLKIDLSFIRDISTDRQSEAIVRSIVSLGAGLDLDVVAEGVESVEQLEILESMGCPMVQGYLISRPLPENEYLAWVRNWKRQKQVLGATASLCSQ